MKRLIYLKNGQSFDFLVSPLKLSSHDFVDHVAHGFKTKREKMSSNCRSIKMIFLFLNNIDSVANPFKYIFVHMRQKKNIHSLVICVMQKYRLLWSSFTGHNDEKSEKNITENCFKSVKVLKGNCYLNSISMIFSLILNLPIKRPSVQKTLHFSAIR